MGKKEPTPKAREDSTFEMIKLPGKLARPFPRVSTMGFFSPELRYAFFLMTKTAKGGIIINDGMIPTRKIRH
jgi:hypothetical protein